MANDRSFCVYMYLWWGPMMRLGEHEQVHWVPSLGFSIAQGCRKSPWIPVFGVPRPWSDASRSATISRVYFKKPSLFKISVQYHTGVFDSSWERGFKMRRVRLTSLFSRCSSVTSSTAAESLELIFPISSSSFISGYCYITWEKQHEFKH